MQVGHDRERTMRRLHHSLAFVCLSVLALMTPQLSAQASKVADVPSGGSIPFAVSPDGKLFAEMGTGMAFGNLVVRDLETDEIRSLTRTQLPQAVVAAVFSPDGERIGYSWQNEDGSIDIRVVEVSGSEPRILYRDQDVRYAVPKAWSPDGQQLLVVTLRTDSTGHVGLVSASDGSFEELMSMEVHPRLQIPSSPVWGESPRTMAFSPDGRFIAYDLSERSNAPNHDIRILAADGTGQGILVQHSADDRLLGWTPDGRGIVFASDRAGSVDLWRLPVTDGGTQGDPEVLVTDVGPHDPSTYTQDGSYYYLVRGGRCALYLMDLQTDSLDLLYTPRLIAPAFHTSGVDWSPDGQRLAYVAPAGGVSPRAWTVAIRSLETGAVRTLPQDVDILHRLYPQWSPDGRSLLANGWDPMAPPGELVYRIDVETGARTTITSTPSLWERMIEWVGWAGDGEAVTYVVPPGYSGTARVIRFDPEFGEETELLARTVPPYPYGHNMSPDGRYIALGLYSHGEPASTLEIVSESGESHELPGAWGPPLWFPDSRRFLYLAGNDLWLASVDGAQLRHLGTIELPTGMEISAGRRNVSRRDRGGAVPLRDVANTESASLEWLTRLVPADARLTTKIGGPPSV
jgi:Tol biopolymer transport system component